MTTCLAEGKAVKEAKTITQKDVLDALEGLPEYPHYTRPPEYRGWGVPEVLLSGDHARVREWRLEESRRRGAEPNTQAGRPPADNCR